MHVFLSLYRLGKIVAACGIKAHICFAAIIMILFASLIFVLNEDCGTKYMFYPIMHAEITSKVVQCGHWLDVWS